MLGNSIEKSENDIPNIVKKAHNFIRKTKSYLKKNPNDFEKLYPDFSEKGKEGRPAGHVGVFCQNLGITAYILENYPNFKSNFSFNNESILKIHDSFRTRGNASFNNLSQIINTLSNQDFAGFDKFKLREILGKMKEMRAQLLKNIYIYIRNESSMSDVLSSPFSPAITMGNTSLAAGENTSLTLEENLYWKVSFLNHRLKEFLLHGRLFLY